MTQTPPRRPGSHLRELASEPCPRCNGIYEKGATECGSCGLIFAKMKKPGSTVPVGPVPPAKLEEDWGKVMNNYSDEAGHLALIEQCIESKNVLFVSQKYKKLLEANPNDEIAAKMRDKILQKVTAIYLTRIPGMDEETGGFFRKAIFLGIGLGLSLAVLGLMLPGSTGRFMAFAGAIIFAAAIGFYVIYTQNN